VRSEEYKRVPAPFWPGQRLHGREHGVPDPDSGKLGCITQVGLGETSSQDVGINDTFECTLGADPSIRLTFARTAKPAQVEGGAFAEPTRTVAYAVITTIKNTHGFDLPRVVVRDSVPVAGEDKRIRVVLRKPAKLADAKEGESVSMDGVKVSWGKHGLRDGQLEWVAEVKSGAEVKLETEFEVRAPADSKWQLRLDA
jgi:hypothetical protein